MTDELATDRPAVVVVAERSGLCADALARLSEDPNVLAVVSSARLDNLAAAITAVAAGYVLAGTEVKAAAAHAPQLSDRQRSVLEQLLTAASNDEIAQRVGISLATVKRELTALAAALGVDGRAAIVAAAHRLGWAVALR